MSDLAVWMQTLSDVGSTLRSTELEGNIVLIRLTEDRGTNIEKHKHNIWFQQITVQATAKPPSGTPEITDNSTRFQKKAKATDNNSAFLITHALDEEATGICNNGGEGSGKCSKCMTV